MKNRVNSRRNRAWKINSSSQRAAISVGRVNIGIELSQMALLDGRMGHTCSTG